jgi:hypothetical protein
MKTTMSDFQTQIDFLNRLADKAPPDERAGIVSERDSLLAQQAAVAAERRRLNEHLSEANVRPLRPPAGTPLPPPIPDKLPSRLPVTGPDGKFVRNPDGSIKTLPRPGVPPPPPGQHLP